MSPISQAIQDIPERNELELQNPDKDLFSVVTATSSSAFALLPRRQSSNELIASQSISSRQEPGDHRRRYRFNPCSPIDDIGLDVFWAL